MATADDYASRIRQLLEERNLLAEAPVRIDQTLDSIGTLLGHTSRGLSRACDNVLGGCDRLPTSPPARPRQLSTTDRVGCTRANDGVNG